MLGLQAKDLVTKFEGVVSSVNFGIDGIIQASLTPEKDSTGKLPESEGFDVSRIETTGKKPVMKQPTFDAESLGLLGMEARDRITEFHGVIVMVGFDLYGCVQAVIMPRAGEAGKMEKGMWFDVNRIQPQGIDPVMERPNFVEGSVAKGDHGPAKKPDVCGRTYG